MNVPAKLLQRHLVIIKVDDEVIEEHPVLVISCERANSLEDGRNHPKNRGRRYIGVMMTTSPGTKGVFSFPVDNEMFEAKLKKENCHFRMHVLVTFYHNDQVHRLENRMKPKHFEFLMKDIQMLTFGLDNN